MKKMALHFENIDEETVRCNLCPHRCVLKPGQAGLCRVRVNEDGILVTLNYGEISAIAMDPIEKKPLFHFNPGDKILSVSTVGCNLRCPFCQNWEIAHENAPTRRVTPEQLVRIAVERGSKGIAYTYNEPVIWYEFVLDTARIAVKEGLYNVLVTNGYIEEEPLKLLLQSIHAMNIDLKGWNDEFYLKEIGGKKEVVMRTIKMAYEAGIHVEVTTLIIPGKNDDPAELEEEFKWLASIDENIPLHLSRYFPNYKYTIPPTPPEKLIEIYNLAKKYLNFVYIGNLWDPEYETTVCPKCGNVVIKRVGYEIDASGMDEEGRCKVCGFQIARIF